MHPPHRIHPCPRGVGRRAPDLDTERIGESCPLEALLPPVPPLDDGRAPRFGNFGIDREDDRLPHGRRPRLPRALQAEAWLPPRLLRMMLRQRQIDDAFTVAS